MSEPKRLTKSASDKVILGICGGFAAYFNTDPTIARIAYILITVLTGFIFGIIGYFVLGVVIPEEGNV